FLILPLFAFVNAGVDLRQVSFASMAGSVPLGIMAGLFFGKQIGVFVFSWISIQLGFVKLPKGSKWIQFYGVSVLTGIGFTMSLFVDSLAFDNETLFQHADRLAILLASFASALFGYLILRFSQGGANQELSNEETKEEVL
ncbi:MAG: Na+/H+ antiporter NhaA, partial [Deltaproteobacteria bacterium]